MTIEFREWPKISRLNRTITVSEKIDGTNAAVGIQSVTFEEFEAYNDGPARRLIVSELGPVLVYAQSRKRIITPDDDNFGFAAWVHENAAALAYTLEPGLHFGEWWGKGIQRGYGLDEKRFSLFNTKRWAPEANGSGALTPAVPALFVVPVLYEGPFTREAEVFTPWNVALEDLAENGSAASPGFMSPEGIVIYHHALNGMFKVTLQGDEAPKSMAA